MKKPSTNPQSNTSRLGHIITAVVLPWIACGQILAQSEVPRLSIWPDGAPLGDGKTEKTDVSVTIYQPEAGKSKHTAMVVCAGGGYGMVTKKGEGPGMGKWLAENGIVGVVLEYRLPRQRPHVPLIDAQRAIRTTRAHAADWSIDPHRVGIIGFSAGGHLASTAVTHFDDGKPDAKDPVERLSSRPDFGVLLYPVITMGDQTHPGSRKNLLGPDPKPELVRLYSNELQVTAKTPPVFLAHALNDTAVPIANSRLFHEALLANRVPSKLIELPSGGHGLNGNSGPMWETWQKEFLTWLNDTVLKPTPP